MRAFKGLWVSLAVAMFAAATVAGSTFGIRDNAAAQIPISILTVDVTVQSPPGYVSEWGVGLPFTEASRAFVEPGESVGLMFAAPPGSTSGWLVIWFSQEPNNLPPADWTPPQITCESSLGRAVQAEWGPSATAPETVVGWTVGFISGEDLTCTVHAEPLTRELVIEKQFTKLYGGQVLGTADVPTLSGLPPEAELLQEGFDGNTYEWRYEVPIDWGGTITESPKPGWFPAEGVTTCEVEAPDVEVEQSELRIEAQEAEPDCTFVNEYGVTRIVTKTYVSSSMPQPSDYPSFVLPSGSIVTPADPPSPTAYPYIWYHDWYIVVPPDWEGDIQEAGHEDWQNVYSECLDFTGLRMCFFDNWLRVEIRVEKWEDVNRNGILDAGDVPVEGAHIREHAELVPVPPVLGGSLTVSRFTGPDGAFTGTRWEADSHSFEEVLAPGWVFVASEANGVWNEDILREVDFIVGEVNVVRFLNRRALVDITASKTIFNNANPTGGNGGAGWQFTLSGCGVGPLQGTTGAGGSVTWSDLPAAVDCEYTVTETPKAGWVADYLTRTAAPLEDGSNTTVTFVNRQIEGCFNVAQCGPAVTQSSPTATPTATVADPSATSSPEPTATAFVPEETVAGEATPGPGANPTPIAPATGGSTPSTAAGLSLLAILGTIALASGATILLAGRRR